MTKFFTRNIEEQHQLDRLLPCVKLLSSIALKSARIATLVKRVANAYYMRTLAELLPITSSQNRMLLLSIIEDLVRLNLPLELETNPLLQSEIKFGGWLPDFLYAFAKREAELSKDFDRVK
jgi:hypothetical protein